jgi:hypothetical protein
MAGMHGNARDGILIAFGRCKIDHVVAICAQMLRGATSQSGHTTDVHDTHADSGVVRRPCGAVIKGSDPWARRTIR